MPRGASRLVTVAVYAVAMAFVEAAVVVYLRALYYPAGFVIAPFPRVFYLGTPPGLLHVMSPLHTGVELVREASTIVMLGAVGVLAGRTPRQRLGAFLYAFGLWDIFYYVFLWLTVRWPASLRTWDILFLIPVPWLGPVWLPVAISVAFVLGGGAFLHGRR